MSKLPHVGTTIFTVMSRLASEYGAVNLSQGFPNFPIDQRLVELLRESAAAECHQYQPMAGNPVLLRRVAEQIALSYKRTVNPESELLVTAGATQAIFTSIMALIKAGDEVLVLDPAYDCYDPAVVLAGGKAIHVPLNNEYLVDWSRVEASLSHRTRMLIVNNPHNPSGRVWQSSDFEALKQLLKKFPEMVLLSDEVYEYITFGSGHHSVNSIPELRERAIIVSSFGKTFHITGWKIGYLVAPENLMLEIRKVHQFNVFSVNSVAQHALSAYLAAVDHLHLGTFYQEKRDLFRSLMAASRFTLLPCEGTYFQVADYSAISDENDVEFCKRMVLEFGVAAIPLSVFNADQNDRKHIRFCFAKTDETIINATDRLCKI